MNPDELDRDAITKQVSENLLDEIRKGDLDHGLSVANMLLSEGPNFSPALLIILVESVIELSAQSGSEDAKKYLVEKWPVLKRAHLQRLTRNQRSKSLE